MNNMRKSGRNNVLVGTYWYMGMTHMGINNLGDYLRMAHI